MDDWKQNGKTYIAIAAAFIDVGRVILARRGPPIEETGTP